MGQESSTNTLVIILHEIYGVNAHIDHFGKLMVKESFDIKVPNLIHRSPFSYEQEKSAYQYFMNEIGFERALMEVKEIIQINREMYDQIFVVGFSVGATVAWLCSEQEVEGIIGYYGSRIRDYKDLVPKCPVLLFFASGEESFNTMDLHDDLKMKKNTEIRMIEAAHGFMDPYHQTFNPQEFRKCMEGSIEFLKRLERN